MAKAKKPKAKTRKPKEKRTELFLVLDRSGSMQAIREDVIGGLNAFMRQQAEAEGECTVSVMQFDHEWEMLHSGLPVEKVPEWTPETYVPRGSTALLDAIHRGIGMLEERVAKSDDDPHRLIVIMTDGLENCSSEVDRHTVMERVERMKADGCGFIYLGANQDAIQVGASMAMPTGSSATYSADSKGVAASMSYATRAVQEFRSTGLAASLDASPGERSAMVGGRAADATTGGSLTDTQGAARILGVSPSTVRRLRNSGTGPTYVKPSPGAVRYRREDLDAWLRSQSS